MVEVAHVAAEHESFNCICQVVPSNYGFLSKCQSAALNAISIGSAVFVDWPKQRHRERPRYVKACV